MTRYLTTSFDWQTREVTAAVDELPLWSAPFGLLLLDNLPLGPFRTALDIGCGTGFPLLDLAQRLGSGCQVIGVDPWEAAVERAREKARVFQVENVQILAADAAQTGFANGSFDLIVSNLGLNNFEKPERVLAECRRLMHPGSVFAATTNLTGTFAEFYQVFEAVLHEQGLVQVLPAFARHVAHRGTLASHRAQLEAAGLAVEKTIPGSFTLRYASGSAFLNHSFILLGFMDTWRELIPSGARETFFTRLAEALDQRAAQTGELRLSVPMAYFECRLREG